MRKILILLALAIMLVGSAMAAEPKIKWNQIANTPFNVKDYGAVGDGVADDAPAIELARQAAIADGGGIVYFPAGTYRLATSQASSENTPFIPDNTTFFKPANYTYWMGVPGSSTIKVGDNYRTAWRGATVIGDFDLTSYTHDWGVYGLKFDMNGQNNLVTDHALGFTDAAIKGAAVQASYCGNVTIENCVIENVTGWNAIVLEGYYYRGLEPENTNVRNCVFRNLGNDMPGNTLSDFTAIYVGNPRSTVEGNDIYGLNMQETDMCGIELHADKTIARNNRIINIANGIYSVMDTGEGDVDIYENTIQARHKGVAIWGSGFRHKTARIADNNIKILADHGISQEPVGIAHGYMSGIWYWSSGVGDPTWATENLEITGNTVVGVAHDVEQDKLIGIAVENANSSVIQGNVVQDVTQHGTLIYNLNTSNPIKFNIEGNTYDGFGSYNDSTSYCGVYAAAVGVVTSGFIHGNTATYETKSYRVNNAIGYEITGPGTKNVTVENNHAYNCWLDAMSGVEPDAFSTVVVEMHGTTTPAYGGYGKGSIVWNTAPSAGGPAFWICTTAGTPGTWKAVNLAA